MSAPGILVLEINIERTIRVILKRHPAADREPVALICNLKTVRIIVRDRPERFDGRSLPLSAAENSPQKWHLKIPQFLTRASGKSPGRPDGDQLADAVPFGGRERRGDQTRGTRDDFDLHRQGLSVSAIARQLCVDRKTVRSAIAKGLEPPQYKTRPQRSRITDPFEPYLKKLAAYPGLTAVRLWRSQGTRIHGRLQRSQRLRARPAAVTHGRFRSPLRNATW